MPYVYRYKDLFDERYKYIGIVKGDTYNALVRRIKQHRKDDWFKNSEFFVDYIDVPTRSDAEAIESSLIGKYETYRYYNKAKASWGEATLFSIDDKKWMEYGIESLQIMYKKSIASMEEQFIKLLNKNKELNNRNKILENFLLKSGMETVSFVAIKSSLIEKANLYDSYSIDCNTRTSADKWAYRSNRLRSAIGILESELLEHCYYGYSKEYREDSTQTNFERKFKFETEEDS